jgi:FemAB-related protein (PEP-CTERM system-associated)
MEIEIEKVDNEKNEWENYIVSKHNSSFVDHFAWRKTIENVYGHKHYWYQAKVNDRIKGVLALTLNQHPLFGTYLATAPFGSHGGFYADTNQVAQQLLKKAEELRVTMKAKYVNIRQLEATISLPLNWQDSPIYSSFRIPVQHTAEWIYHNQLSKNVRKQVRNSQKQGYIFKYGSENLLDDFWYIIRRSMKHLGSPYHKKNFLKTIIDQFGDKVEIFVIYSKKGFPLSARFAIRHNDTLSILHGGMIRENQSIYAGVFAYWNLIELCASRHIRWIDLGRSLIGSSQEFFKNKFKPEQIQLKYWYNLNDNSFLPNLNQNNAKYDIPRKLWKYIPLPIQAYIGPYFIKGIL